MPETRKRPHGSTSESRVRMVARIHVTEEATHVTFAREEHGLVGRAHLETWRESFLLR